MTWLTAMAYMCYKRLWICLTCRKHFPILSTFMIYHRVSDSDYPFAIFKLFLSIHVYLFVWLLLFFVYIMHILPILIRPSKINTIIMPRYIIHFNVVVYYSRFVIGQYCNFQDIKSTVEKSWYIFRILVDYRLRHLLNNVTMNIYTHDYIRMEITVLSI